jgi:enoyl-CoA hydratase
MSDDSEVLFETRGALGLITLNRPKALNALTHGMALAMTERLKSWAKDSAVKAVLIRGAGERAFCAGGDIRALYESGKNKTPYALDFYRDEYILNTLIKHYPKPYVALVHGLVMGGGVGVSVHGSHRVVNESVTFAMPETGIGLFPDVGGSYFLSRMRGGMGMYLALTGARLKLADTLYAGVGTNFMPAANNDALIERLADGASPDVALDGLAAATDEAPLINIASDILRMFAHPSVEDIVDALNKGGSPWARDTAAIIATKSPTSLKLAYRQIREGAKLDFNECMAMEYRMVNRIVAGHDFYEGVRATIIDKDGAPKWQPATLGAVNDGDVDAYFAPLGNKELSL